MKLIAWNFIVFISIATVLVLTNMPILTVVVGSIAYTAVMLALAYVYKRVWQAIEHKKSTIEPTTSDPELASLNAPLTDPMLSAWNYYDLASAMVLGAATGWIIKESSK